MQHDWKMLNSLCVIGATPDSTAKFLKHVSSSSTLKKLAWVSFYDKKIPSLQNERIQVFPELEHASDDEIRQIVPKCDHRALVVLSLC